MKLFGSLYDRVMGWARHRYAERYLAAVSFAESSFFPIPVGLMLLPMCLAQQEKAWRLAFITLVASVLGGILGYCIGWGAFELVEPHLGMYASQLEHAKEWFGEYGIWVVLMAGFSPVPYKAFTLMAGSLAMPFIPFVLASIVGRASQFYLVAFLANKLGPSMEPKIRQYVEILGWLCVALIVVIIGWLNFRS